MGLNNDEYNVLTLVEQEYLLSGTLPTYDAITARLPITSRQVASLFERPDFKDALSARGIRDARLDPAVESGLLTTEQLMCVNVLLDQNDNRSDRKKLGDLGITTQKYQGWCRDPAFQDYLRKRTEALFPDGINEANRALVDNVKRGDLGSIKLLYEMTGRWSSKPVSEMNIEWVLMKVIETISRHVTDPLTLAAIADDLNLVNSEVNTSTTMTSSITLPALAVPVHASDVLQATPSNPPSSPVETLSPVPTSDPIPDPPRNLQI